MKKIFLISITLFYSVLFCQNSGNKTFSLLESKYNSGEISYSEMVINKFHYVFDISKLDKKFNLTETSPIKCLTTLINSFYKNKEKFNESEIKIIEEYLNRPWQNKNTLAVFNSPGGKFQLTYTTSGIDAVPAADNNGNGVPDFVEWVASYFDYSWAFEIDSLGLLPPPIGSGKYQIGFESMGAYGYTGSSGSGTLTYIVMHNNFLGFPPNNDPEGGQKGAAKVTAAHEFKHASQINYNYWNEPGWFIEIDATWMEDIAYDYVNDYYNYVNYSGSPFVSPGQSLDAGDGYEDCVWMLYLTEKNGVLLNKRLWVRRTNNNENIFNTFDFILSNYYSTTFIEAFKEFGIWNIMTGSRAVSGYGYGEASAYATSALCKTITTFPASSANCSITKYSNNFFRINPLSNNKYLAINFNGVNGSPYFKVGVIYKKLNGTVQIAEFVLDANNDGNFVSVIPNNEISFVGFSVSSVTSFTAPTFSVSVSEQDMNIVNMTLNEGWNLLSIPFNAASMDFTTLFPEAASYAFVFTNGVYTQSTTAQVGKAFWIKFNSGSSKNISGTPQTSINIPVTTGWNMIGPLNFDLPVTSIITNPTGIIASDFYEFNNAYFPVTMLKAGKGYWIKVSSNGLLTLQL